MAMSCKPAALLVAGLTVAGIAGCGSSGSSAAAGPGGAAATIPAAVRHVVQRWAQAATPRAECPLLTYAFLLGNAKGKNPADCPAWIASVEPPLNTTVGLFVSGKRVDGQEAVTVHFANYANPVTVYLTRECGTWKINSFGKVRPNPPPPPHC